VAKGFGVVTRYPRHAEAVRPAFWEVKDVGGARRAPRPGTVPMVSCFGDNRVARTHPDWVQVGPGGMRADRTAPYFDWDALCPTRPEVRRLALEWVAAAVAGGTPGTGLRLDDVTYAREGFCQCPVCRAEAAAAGEDLDELHARVIRDFVREVRARVAGPLYFTLFPDPFPGRLERRFGIHPAELDLYVDAYVVPLYDLAYGTTYWLEVLASAFAERLARPFWVELYALGVPEERLVKAALVAATYAAGVLLAYGNRLETIRQVESALRERFG
jgi:hypothetical protein